MSEEIKVYINSNEDGFITDCYFADNTKVSCEFYHEESEIEYSNCKLLNLQDYIKEKDQQIVYLQSQLDQANERLKGAIVPKFDVGQEIWEITPLMPWKIKRIEWHKFNGGYGDVVVEIYRLGHDGTDDYNCCIMPVDSDRFFTTEQEAQAKLQELRGGE